MAHCADASTRTLERGALRGPGEKTEGLATGVKVRALRIRANAVQKSRAQEIVTVQYGVAGHGVMSKK